ncbi:SPOSA6832_00497 [Sporobolomyces salmonicolor]|uniref:SPOSA6832_00497-mRNA-1:cds n=1 Tax=Sporidiobolus salmonicolor TaxID=5005 RepID=A0A0D6EGB5_SPOSA|nr:SPOSA6832_00497 [Sporobolomyces salmonicolor]
MGPALLYLTLAFALISFFCSTYTTLRTLLPLLPGHPLNRRNAGSAVGPYDPVPSPSLEKLPRLKSAQRFTAYLAAIDIRESTSLPHASSFGKSLQPLAAAFNSAARSWPQVESTSRRPLARPCCLSSRSSPTPTSFKASSISSVFSIRSFSERLLMAVPVQTSRSPWVPPTGSIVWGPALVIYAGGAGLASIARVDSPPVWIGLAVWLTAVSAVVSLCFGRLLVAILRVRRISQREQAFSPWAREQEKVVSVNDLPYPAFLRTHAKFSDLSTNFVNAIGRSSSSVNLSNSHTVIPFASDSRSAVSYAPSRPSGDGDEIEEFDFPREFRSPTPGSTHGLLDRSTKSALLSCSTEKPRSSGEHEVLSFEGVSRPSIGESITSRASTYLAPGGFIGNSVVRQAIIRDAWGDQSPPGTGHSPKVELSDREARGAMVRIGGHLFGSLLGYALISPFAFLRLLHPSSTAPLIASIFLSIGVCQPGVILAWQCWASEGFWFRRPIPPVLTSSSALAFEQFEGVEVVGNDEMRERSASRASTARTWKDSLPGIRPEGEDCAETDRSRVGRALTMMQAHPKLQVLHDEPARGNTSSTSGFVKSATTGGHARLRSLKLSKATVGSLGEFGRTRPRSGSAATVGGFEHHARVSSMPVNSMDKLIAMQLLNSRKHSGAPVKPRIPHSAGKADSASRSVNTLLHRKQTPSPAPTPSSSPAPSPAPTSDFAFTTHEVTLSPATTSFPSSGKTPALDTLSHGSLPTYSIDHLSAKVLPHLVPSIKLGKDLHVEPEDAPLPPRRSSLSAAYPSSSVSLAAARSMRELGVGSRRSRNVRNLSLPGLLLHGAKESRSPDELSAAQDATWVAIEDDKDTPTEKTPETVLASLKQAVSGEGSMPKEREKSKKRKSWKDRSAKKWDEIEQREKQKERTPGRAEAAALTEEKDSDGGSKVHERAGSGATCLDVSLEWEDGGATEVLDDRGTFADESASDYDDEEAEAVAFDAHQRARRAASPFSPLSPPSPFLSSRQPPPQSRRHESLHGSVVLRGSQVIDEDEDIRTGTVQCATVRPISRNSDSSSIESSSRFALRPTHVHVGSVGSVQSLSSVTRSSITSEGFRNMLAGHCALPRPPFTLSRSLLIFLLKAWHSRTQDVELSSSDDPGSNRNSLNRRSLPSPPVQPGHRPLSLLGQRDLNVSSASEPDMDREQKKAAHYRTATQLRDDQQQQTRCSSRRGIPLPPIPTVPTIEEADEDRKSGTPTPRARRLRSATATVEERRAAQPMAAYPPNLGGLPSPGTVPPSASQPTRTHPNITSRLKLRARHHRGESSTSSVNDENVVAARGRPVTSAAATRPAASVVHRIR